MRYQRLDIHNAASDNLNGTRLSVFRSTHQFQGQSFTPGSRSGKCRAVIIRNADADQNNLSSGTSCLYRGLDSVVITGSVQAQNIHIC